jgi:TolB protein
MRRPYILVAALLLAAAGITAVAPAAGAETIRVTKSAGEKIAVDASGLQASGPSAGVMRQTLIDDISRSGWMGLGAPGRSAITLRGQAAESAGSISFACTATDAGGNAFINGTYTVPAGQAVSLAHQVADDLVRKVTGKPTFFLAKLAMVGSRSGARELYVADSSARDIRQVTSDRAGAVKPRWSPDNRLISYTSFIKRYPDVYTIDLATGQRQRVASYPGVNSGGAISPDGRSMALILSKDGNPDLYVMNLASRSLTRLTRTPTAVEGSPSWSPDGSQIVYVSDASGSPQLWTVSARGGAPARLTTLGQQNAAPDWGANGLIAYQSLVGGKFQIAVIDPRTREPRVLTDYQAAYEDPSWAPDGRHIACSRAVGYQYSICLLDTMGDPPVVLTKTGDWRTPAWQH